MAAEKTKHKQIGDVHPLGHLLDEWAEWVTNEGEGSLSISYDQDDDSFLVNRNGREAVLYTSEIDGDFYGDAQALFAESEVGIAPANLNWAQTLVFSGNELVLSRISISVRDDKPILLVEGAFPHSKVTDFALFDLLVREVSTIGRDLRKQLGGIMIPNVSPGDAEDDEEYDEEYDDEENEDEDDDDDR